MANGSRNEHPNALPNYQNAVILREKLEGYALNPTHEAIRPGGSSGKDKARVFKNALGFDQSNWEVLKQCLLAELPFNEAVLETEKKQYGKVYRVDLQIQGMNGNIASVRTVWILKDGTDYPSLVTLLVLL
ncbi:MAG TPA: hypothetical protein VJX74_12330 [Blastocatellia bacterium]|nr:hypothetical protein [Blastocatellia bacterium]